MSLNMYYDLDRSVTWYMHLFYVHVHTWNTRWTDTTSLNCYNRLRNAELEERSWFRTLQYQTATYL